MDYHFDDNAKTLYTPGTTQARDKQNSHKHTAKSKRRLPRVPSFGKTIRFVHDRIASQIPSRIHRHNLARSTFENGLYTLSKWFLFSSPLSLLRWPRHARTQQRHDKLARVGAFATRSCVRATNNGILRQYVRQRCKKGRNKT